MLRLVLLFVYVCYILFCISVFLSYFIYYHIQGDCAVLDNSFSNVCLRHLRVCYVRCACIFICVYVYYLYEKLESIDRGFPPFFIVFLFVSMILLLCRAILSGGLFGLAAVFPPRYTGTLMNGQG